MNRSSLTAPIEAHKTTQHAANVKVMTTFDLEQLKKSKHLTPVARKLLNRAINMYGWQPTAMSPDGNLVRLMSEDGATSAVINIAEGKWRQLPPIPQSE